MFKSGDEPESDFAGYPAGRIFGQSKSRIADFRPDIWCRLDTIYPAARISSYFQYPVSGRISGKSNPVFGRIPVPDIHMLYLKG
jgi:hypothetical protein